MPKSFKSCPKSNKLHDLVTLAVSTIFSIMVVCTQLTGDGLIRLEILLEPGKCFCVFKAFSELHDFMKEICEWAFKVWIAPIETRVYLGSNLYDPALKGEWIKYRRMNSSLTSCQRKIGQKWNVFLGLSNSRRFPSQTIRKKNTKESFWRLLWAFNKQSFGKMGRDLPLWSFPRRKRDLLFPDT